MSSDYPYPYHSSGSAEYRSSMAAAVAGLEAIERRDIDGIKAIADTAEPADYGVLLDILYTQTQLFCMTLGFRPADLIRGMRAGINDMMARPVNG